MTRFTAFAAALLASSAALADPVMLSMQQVMSIGQTLTATFSSQAAPGHPPTAPLKIKAMAAYAIAADIERLATAQKLYEATVKDQVAIVTKDHPDDVAKPEDVAKGKADPGAPFRRESAGEKAINEAMLPLWEKPQSIDLIMIALDDLNIGEKESENHIDATVLVALLPIISAPAVVKAEAPAPAPAPKPEAKEPPK
jgi:hypothetical protein